jgi:Helix-turn-helix domain
MEGVAFGFEKILSYVEVEVNEVQQNPPHLLDHSRVKEILRYLVAGIDPETGEMLSDGVLSRPSVRYSLTMALEALTKANEPSAPQEESQRPRRSRKSRGSGKDLNQTSLDTLGLFRKGFSPEQIADQRGFQSSTIYGHLGKLISGGALTLNEVVSDEVQHEVRRAYNDAKLPLDVIDVERRMKLQVPTGIVTLTLRHLNLELGRGKLISAAEKPRIEKTIYQAVSQLQGEHRERTIAKILLGSRMMYQHTSGRPPFGELEGYDNGALLDLIEAMVRDGKLVKEANKLCPGRMNPVPSNDRGVRPLTDDDIPF